MDHIILDGNYELARKDLVGSSNVKFGDSIDFEAIKRRYQQFQFRCIWGKVMAPAAQKEMFPLPTVVVDKIEKSLANRTGITIDMDEVIFKLEKPGDSQEQFLLMKNISAKKSVQLIAITLSPRTNLTIIEPDFQTGPYNVRPLTQLKIRIRATAQSAGMFPESIIFEFGDFQLMRNLKLVCGDSEFVIKYTTEYIPPIMITGAQMLANMNKTRRQKPRKAPRTFSSNQNQTKKWEFPVDMKELLLHDDWRPQLDITRDYIFEELIPINYQETLHTCLFIAELELFRQFQQKCQFGVRLEKSGSAYVIFCKDVADTRPSLMVDDQVYCENEKKGLMFQGCISEVGENQVLVKMEEGFNAHSLLAFDISFEYSRKYYRLQHDAIDLLVSGKRFDSLFPTKVIKEPALLHVDMEANGRLTLALGADSERRPLTLTRHDLNTSQRQVIRNVLRAEYRSLPYMIRGPPGTGKTTTLTEIIVQLATHCPESKILVCTQSNSAANLILAKLVEMGRFTKRDMMRIIGAQAYRAGGILDELRQYCGTFSSGTNANPLDALKEENNGGIQMDLDLESISEIQVVILTCGSAGRLVQMRLSTTHFSHLILDEAGQCHETEAIMAISMMEKPDSQIILAGDDKQLGPVVDCPELEDAGFAVSLFERIMKCKYYNEEHPEMNATLANTLNYNYRSVPSILHIYNGLFYKFALKAMVSFSIFRYKYKHGSHRSISLPFRLLLDHNSST